MACMPKPAPTVATSPHSSSTTLGTAALTPQHPSLPGQGGLRLNPDTPDAPCLSRLRICRHYINCFPGLFHAAYSRHGLSDGYLATGAAICSGTNISSAMADTLTSPGLRRRNPQQPLDRNAAPASPAADFGFMSTHHALDHRQTPCAQLPAARPTDPVSALYRFTYGLTPQPRPAAPSRSTPSQLSGLR